MFFDSIDIACVNAFVIYKKLENDDFSLEEYKLQLRE